MAEFEPRIIAFLCNWCTYTGADLAGTSRIQYPPNVRIVRLMCSGRLDPVYVLKSVVEDILYQILMMNFVVIHFLLKKKKKL